MSSHSKKKFKPTVGADVAGLTNFNATGPSKRKLGFVVKPQSPTDNLPLDKATFRPFPLRAATPPNYAKGAQNKEKVGQSEHRAPNTLDPAEALGRDLFLGEAVHATPPLPLYMGPRSNPQMRPRSNPQMRPRSNPQMRPRSNPQMGPPLDPQMGPRLNPQMGPPFNSQMGAHLPIPRSASLAITPWRYSPTASAERDEPPKTEKEGKEEKEEGKEEKEEEKGEEKEKATPKPKENLVLKRFMQEYAAQNDMDGVAEHLREQLLSAQGMRGSLDVDRCLDIIEAHDVTLVVTDTGTGKSSLIPKGLYERDSTLRIVNCQPRRTSAINLAQRVSQLLGNEEPGEIVGYSVRGEVAGELGKTPIMYITNFTLLLFLLWRRPEDVPFTHIILDDFHERGPEIEVILVLLKLVLQKNSKMFKIILCSATAQADEWIDFFDNFSVGEYKQAKEMFPVHKYYMDDICKLVGTKCPLMNFVANNIVGSLQLHSITAVIKKTLSFLARVLDPSHGILVFLPGRNTVESFAKWIKENLNNELDPIMWHAGVDLAYIQEAIQRKPSMKKKVYLATDIAEVSLTLPDVVVAIDSGMQKRPLISEENPYSVVFPPLELLWEGSLSARQRSGRVGRVQQGFYFSMLHRDHFNHLLRGDSRTTNSVLSGIILLSLHLTEFPSNVFGLCYEKPRPISILRSLDILVDGGFIISGEHKLASQEVIQCIRHKNNDAIVSSNAWRKLISESQSPQRREELVENVFYYPDPINTRESVQKPRPCVSDYPFQKTLKGFFVTCLHTSIQPASVAFYGVMLNIPMLGIVASVVESVKNPFNMPYDICDKVEKLRMRNTISNTMRTFKGSLNSDIVSSVGAVLKYMEVQYSGFSDEAQEEWCKEHFISRIRLTEMVSMIQQMKEHVSIFSPLPQNDDIDDLLDQYDRYAHLLNFICVGSHLQNAVYMQKRKDNSRQSQKIGSGIFIKMNIENNIMAPSVCPWLDESVCVPFTLRTSYSKLCAEFATQIDPVIFNLATLIFAFCVTFRYPDTLGERDEKEGSQGGGGESIQRAVNSGDWSKFFLFKVAFMRVSQTFACDMQTGQQIIQLRRMLCARLRAMCLFLEHQAEIKEDLEANKKKYPEKQGQDDFGIPDSYLESPSDISALLQQGLTELLNRFENVRGNISIHQRRQREKNSKDGETKAFCTAINHPHTMPSPAMESLLVHSCNGIFEI